jgi:hypothetical protein
LIQGSGKAGFPVGQLKQKLTEDPFRFGKVIELFVPFYKPVVVFEVGKQ